jgi:Spo7-like protein
LQYYYIHLFHRISLLGGLFTLVLYYVSSLFHRTLIYPKKYLSHTNKSLRQFNLKLVPNSSSSPLRNLPVVRWFFPPKTVLGEGGVKVVLNQRGGIEGEFIEGWEMFREDFWEEEERLRREEQERIKREGRRPSVQPIDPRPNSGRPKTASGTAGSKKKKKASVSGSVSSVKTSSTGTAGSLKEKGAKKKKKRTAEQAVAGL